MNWELALGLAFAFLAFTIYLNFVLRPRTAIRRIEGLPEFSTTEDEIHVGNNCVLAFDFENTKFAYCFWGRPDQFLVSLPKVIDASEIFNAFYCPGPLDNGWGKSSSEKYWSVIETNNRGAPIIRASFVNEMSARNCDISARKLWGIATSPTESTLITRPPKRAARYKAEKENEIEELLIKSLEEEGVPKNPPFGEDLKSIRKQAVEHIFRNFEDITGEEFKIGHQKLLVRAIFFFIGKKDGEDKHGQVIGGLEASVSKDLKALKESDRNKLNSKLNLNLPNS